MLNRLLGELPRQETDNTFTFSVVVTDNDAGQSARRVVEQCIQTAGIEIVYSVEPIQNIALARNRALAHATGDYIAFIDDDEFPVQNWLLDLFRACEKWDGVLGPVLPHFDE